MAELSDLNLDFLPDDLCGIYLVGGTVRDLLMSNAPADIDLAVKGDIVQVAETIAEKSGGRVIDLGKKGFAVLRVVAPGLIVDITPLDGQTIEEDLCQRDFTINAMAFDVRAGRLVDCTGGLSDLRQRAIRMVSDSTFINDPARLVRAYRMAGVFGFSMPPETRAAIGRDKGLIGSVAGERVWAEMLKLLGAPRTASVIRDMAADGLLTAIFPELKPAIGCVQNGFHQFDVFEHSVRTYAQLECLLADADQRFGNRVPAGELANLAAMGPLVKYAALLHDAGKPATGQARADGSVRFPGHAGRSAAIADAISQRLRLSKSQRETANTIIRNHIRPLSLFQSLTNGTLGQRGTIRFFNHCATLTLPILVHSIADAMAKREALQPREGDFIAFCERLIDDYADYRNRQADAPPLINGHDLIKVFGLFPAPRFKWILSRVEERRLSGELSTREEALNWVKAQLESHWANDRTTS